MPIDRSKLVLDLITAHHFRVEPVKINPGLGEGFLDRISMIGGRPLPDDHKLAIALSRPLSAANRSWSSAFEAGERGIGSFDFVLESRTSEEKKAELRIHVEDASILAYEPFDYLDVASDRLVNERLVLNYSRIRVESVLLDEEDDDV